MISNPKNGWHNDFMYYSFSKEDLNERLGKLKNMIK